MTTYNAQAIRAKLSMARAYCAERLPWFAPILYHCEVHLSSQVVVAAIDEGLRVYFNPEAVQAITNRGTVSMLAELGFLWVHEVSHLLRRHAERARAHSGIQARLWNIAADLEIKDAAWEGLSIPAELENNWLSNYSWAKGESAEYYYEKLQEKASCQDHQRANWDEGSGVHGQYRPWEIESAKPQDINNSLLAITRQQVAQVMQQHLSRLPENWRRWVSTVMTPKVDWRKMLRHRLRIAVQVSLGQRLDYSYQRPNRRQSVQQPFVLPAKRGEQQASLAIVVDTSGSMEPVLLGQAVAEVCAVLEVFRLPVKVIPCDMRVYHPITVRLKSDYVKLQQLVGGGSTDMNVGIEAALALRPRPDAILVLTDGYTPWPLKRIDVPLLFGIFDDSQQPAPWPPNPPWTKDMIVRIPI